MSVYEISKSAKFADLDIPVSGLYLLAAPSTPDEVRSDAIDRAANGETLADRAAWRRERPSAMLAKTVRHGGNRLISAAHIVYENGTCASCVFT